jgi:O-glycosyl hydrolase
MRFFNSYSFTSACLVLLGSVASANSTITVHPTQLLQRIDGFGASDAWYAWEIHWFSVPEQEKIFNTLFSTSGGAGLSLLRHRVPPEIEPSAGNWDWTQDNDTVWFSKQAVAHGVSQVWSTVWSPPAWMKTNNNVNEGGAVSPSHYQDYATFLATYAKHYATAFGVNISAISIANEPDQTVFYESSNWSSQQFHDFVAQYMMPTFKAANLTTQVIMPELSYWSDSAAAATLADPLTSNFVNIIASHDYGGTPSPFYDAQNANKKVWETEVSNLYGDDPSINDGVYWAQTLHHTLVDAHANAWHYWWLFADISDTSGQSLISGSPATNSFVTKKRLWTIGNYSRFVRPGWHMVSVSSTNPESGVYVSAYVGTSGTMAIVAINANQTATTLVADTGQSLRTSAFIYRTSATENLSLVGFAPVTLGKINATLAPMSVTTFSVQPLVTPLQF